MTALVPHVTVFVFVVPGRVAVDFQYSCVFKNSLMTSWLEKIHEFPSLHFHW